jgi:hypothetical protein
MALVFQPRLAIPLGAQSARRAESNRSTADDALDLVRMDDDGGWQMTRPTA